MIITLYAILAAIAYYVGYIYSLYSSAVYIEPEKISNITERLTGFRKKYLLELGSNPRISLQLAIILKSFLLIAISALVVLSAYQLIEAYNPNPALCYLIGFAVAWLLYLLFIEYLPRRRVLRVGERGILGALGLLAVVYFLFKPFLALYGRFSISDQGGAIPDDQKEDIIERAIETLAEQAGVSESIVEADEKEMIGQIFQLDVTEVREVMVPRIDIIGINKHGTLEEVEKLTKEHGYSRYPVYDEIPDRIIGILYIKDLFTSVSDQEGPFDITRHIRAPYFVPEKKKISELLKEFKANKVHIAIVVDEYGGTSGLVTLEDILEEIFGEIRDEHDYEEESLIRMSDNSFLVDACVSVEELIEELDLDYETDQFETVGGLIYDLVGSVPTVGTVLRWKDLIFEVERVEGQRIVSVKAWLKKPTE
jgi:putative hemolysin